MGRPTEPRAVHVDLSLPLEAGMPGFPGYPGVETERLQTYEADGKVSHRFGATTHHGTHVDAPAHFVEGGATVDEIPLDALVGPARVVDLGDAAGERIDRATLDAAAPDLSPGARVLLLTGDVDARFGDEDFFDAAAVLTESAADWLLERSVRLVANDFLTESIDDPGRPVHHALLGAGVPVVEYLANVGPVADAGGTVEFACLPLRMSGMEAAPARAMATVEG